MAYPGLSRRAFAGLALATSFSAPRLAAADALPDSKSGAATATGESRYSHITAPVFVNEQGPFTFLVDTGANRSAIGENLARRLEMVQGEPVEVNTVVGARARPTALLSSLRIGLQTQRDVEVPILALGDEGADGILGVDWLHDQRLTFHFPERRLLIEPSAGASPLDVSAPVDRRPCCPPG